MGVDHPRIRDAEALGAQGFQPEVIYPGGDGTFDALRQKLLEGSKQDALHRNRQRQQAIEESRDRGQIVLQTVVIYEAEAGGILKGSKRAPRHIAAIDAAVELPQCVAGIRALEVILGSEQPCPPVWRWPRVIAPRVSRRRAMVLRNRFSAFTSVAMGRNSGGCA